MSCAASLRSRKVTRSWSWSSAGSSANDGHLGSLGELAAEVLAGDLLRERVIRFDAASPAGTARGRDQSRSERAGARRGRRRRRRSISAVPMAFCSSITAACAPVHPLLAAAAVQQSTASQRRELHQLLAEALADELRAAHHLAMATVGQDSERARRLSEAADAAMRRGATLDAVELGAHAFALTPPEDEQLTARMLALGEYLVNAFEMQRLADLLGPRIEQLPPGAPRARAHLMLAEGSADLDEHARHLELALQESRSEPALRALALAMKAELYAVIRVERLDDALAWTQEGLRIVGAGHERGAAPSRRGRVAAHPPRSACR